MSVFTHMTREDSSFLGSNKRLTLRIALDLAIVSPTNSSHTVNPETSEVEAPVHVNSTDLVSSVIPRELSDGYREEVDR